MITCVMETNAFASLAIIQLPSACRLLSLACCPDKDLVMLISRLGGKDRMSLWKMQGSKKWEVDVGSDENSSEEIVGLAWSPDAQTVAVAHDPPRITLHSVQDGREEGVIPIKILANAQRRPCKITGIWWFKEERVAATSSIPDIFRRNGVITGTAHSILKTLPLLGHLQEDSQKFTATDLFAFQGSHIRSIPRSSIPEVIMSWPSLLPDLLTASISLPSRSGTQLSSSGTAIDDTDDSNMNSVLAVADDSGCVYCFLDGSYPLGGIPIAPQVSTSSLFKDPKLPLFYAHPQTSVQDCTITDLHPVTINIPLLDKRDVRDMAKLSSTARELLWYTMRVVKEMRHVWFGSETHTGARELGPKWTRALESKQTEQFGQEEPNPILDLTCLLVTGKASDALLDFLGSGDQISERGIQKWESTMTEALVKLRDFSEKKAAPAFQRLHLVLEEVQGWSLLPKYTLFELPAEDIERCLELTGRAIVVSGWLAAVARRELARFKEFISWLKFETAVANPTNENHPPPRHDILEVNNYFMSGLVVSSIDKWFMGTVPQFSIQDMGLPGGRQDLSAVVERSRKAAENYTQSNVKANDMNHLDRNLDALTQELAARCQQIFIRASGAAARSATVSFGPSSVASRVESARPAYQPSKHLVVRERIIMDKNEAGNFSQHLAIYTPSAHRTFLCLARTSYGQPTFCLPFHIGVTLLECYLADEVQEREKRLDSFDILEVDFFDDETIIVVFRLRTEDRPTYIATVSYNDLGSQPLRPQGYVILPAREDLMLEAMQQWKDGHLASARIPIKRCRRLATCGNGQVSLAVNGRIGRRVACLLDNTGTTMETLDLDGDGEYIEAEEDPEAEADDGGK